MATGGTMGSKRSVTWGNAGLAMFVALSTCLILSAPTSAGAATAVTNETVVGTATITGSPAGWTPSNFYLQICPMGEKYSMSCPGALSGSPDQTTGAFSVTVPATAWKFGMYYYTINGQIILSKGSAVTPQPGATIHHNVTMSYVVPAVSGKVHLTGAPKNFNSLAYMGVQACPARIVFSVGCRNGNEAYEDIGPGSPYLIDLRQGAWKVAAYYRNDGNTKVFSGTPVKFTATKGLTRTVNVTIAYQGV
jgi:hypothetical protein